MAEIDKSFEVRLKKGKDKIEVLVDFDKLKEFKKNPEKINVYDILSDTKIFKDQKKGEVASENHLKELFPDKEEEDIIKEILIHGECQIPLSYTNKIKEDIKKKVIGYITENASNPATKTRYTHSMIEREVEKIKYNYHEGDIIKQAEEIIDKLKSAMPISITEVSIEISIPPKYTSSFYGPFRKFGKITKEYFDNDGNLRLHIKVTEGAVDNVIDYIKNKTKGEGEYHVTKI